MIKRIKDRFRNFMHDEVISVLSDLRENRDRTHDSMWEDQITISLPSSEFENLPSVSHSRDDFTSISPDDLPLEKSLDEYIRMDPYPIPAPQDREGYGGDRHLEYWLSGLNDYLLVKHRLSVHQGSLTPGFSIFDLGAASGRVLRHFLCQEEGLDLWSSDLNSRHVEWTRKFLGGGIRAFQNHALPHLPLEDNSFDLVCAFSVFTHIDVFELPWLLELRRILKPGGLAYVTLHSDHTWSNMKEEHAIYQSLLSHPDFSPHLLKSRMPQERMVYRWETDSSYRANVFHDEKYIRGTWGNYFQILDIIPAGHFYQDAVLLRKPPASTS